jgi:hypothetical protein
VRRSLALLLFCLVLLLPASAQEHRSRWHAVWRVSQLLLIGANTADIASSWGKSEANPLLRTGQRFGYGSMAIKLGVLTGSLTAQHFMARKSPRQIPFFTSANLAGTAVLSAVAARNMHVPR